MSSTIKLYHKKKLIGDNEINKNEITFLRGDRGLKFEVENSNL